MADVTDVVVIGAGVGGLAAAITLAARGLRVEVLEAADRAGGKMGITVIDGVEVDTGPSVLTLTDALDEVLRLSGTSLADELVLRAPVPAFRYLYPDGVVLDVHTELEDTLASVRGVLGTRAAAELQAFLAHAAEIWTAAAPHFVFGPAPSPRSLFAAGPRGWASLARIRPWERMMGAIQRRVRSPHLRMLLARYATYNGSDVRRAPATLNCIAHVELALGGWGVQGGMYEVCRALVRAAERVGVRIRTGVRVDRILQAAGAVSGVQTSAGRVPARQIVANADAAHVFGDLLANARPRSVGELSMSGWNGILRARRRAGDHARVAHTVLFPENYMQEFADIFDRRRPPREPTVYLCAQEACHGRQGWVDAEPVFAMANAPAGSAAPWGELRDAVVRRLDAVGLRDADDAQVWERTPCDLAAEFPGSRGSIYGGASNSPLAAFRRPPNRVRGVRGLYLASGSAHPGGGVPLCLLSGRAASAAVLKDRG